MRAKLSASRDDDGFVKAARARRAGLFLVSAITVLAIWLSSVAQAGFRPGLIAYDEYGITNQIVISGGATIATSGGFGYPTWSPNGDTLAFTRDFTVWLADRN